MSKTPCDHTSVGVLVWKKHELLLIERKIFPVGFAAPAGHIDGDATPEMAAARELKEEVGLEAESLQLVWEGRLENPCSRPDGTWHYWYIYEARVSGRLQPSPGETKQAGWYSKQDLVELGAKTERYIQEKISEEEWQKNPGLELVWWEIFRKIILQ